MATTTTTNGASSALRAAAGVAPAPAAEPKNVLSILTDPRISAQIALALPKHLSVTRLTRIAMTEMRKVPKLAQCEPASFLGAIMQAAQLGLEPGGALGHCYILPYENRRKSVVEAQFILGYKGMIDLARRSDQIVSIMAQLVRERDRFEYEFGSEERLVHVPATGDRGAITHCYAYAKLKGGGFQFEVMDLAAIEGVRDASSGYRIAEANAKKWNREGDSPWHSHFGEMARKTLVRRLFKYLPISIEFQRAAARDELVDAGAISGGLTIDAATGKIEEDDDGAAGDAPAGDAPAGAAPPAFDLSSFLARVEAATDEETLMALGMDAADINDASARGAAVEAVRSRRDALSTRGRSPDPKPPQ